MLILSYVHTIALEHGVRITDDQADYILWEKTGFPEFWTGDPMTCLTKQLRMVFTEMEATK